MHGRTPSQQPLTPPSTGVSTNIATKLLDLIAHTHPDITSLHLSKQATGHDWEWEEPLVFATLARHLLPFNKLKALALCEIDFSSPWTTSKAVTFSLQTLTVMEWPIRPGHGTDQLEWLLGSSQSSLEVVTLSDCSRATVNFFQSSTIPYQHFELSLFATTLDNTARLVEFARRPELESLQVISYNWDERKVAEVVADLSALKNRGELGGTKVAIVGMGAEPVVVS